MIFSKLTFFHRNLFSSIALSICCCALLLTNIFYPTWNKSGVGSTISWDVAGYYAYLPAIFIYDDIKTLEQTSKAATEANVQPDGFSSTCKVANGNSVMTYTIGNAIMMFPFFTIAHTWAKIGNYEANGFSFPYQFCISMGCLLYAFLALYFLRKILLLFFDDKAVAITLLLLVLATNYIEYSAITGALTHNQLFFVYCMLLWFIIKFYASPNLKNSIAVGSLIGLAMLIRPTDAILIALFVLWNVSLSITSIKEKLSFIFTHFKYFFVSAICVLIVFSIQLLYWKYVSNQWLVYTYGNQHFDWFHPHIINGLISYKKGWYIYTPIMFFASIGFYFLFHQHKKIATATLLFMLLNIYVVFSWAIWWYATSLGQRAMVQSYAVMSFPLAAIISWVLKQNKFIKSIAVLLFSGCIYLNINLTWQAHYAIYFEGDNMTKSYLLRTFGRWNIQFNDLKLLDTDEEYSGNFLNKKDVELQNIKLADTIVINAQQQFSKLMPINMLHNKNKWLRVLANFYAAPKEWNVWLMPQLIVRFKNNNREVKTRLIRISRLMNDDKKWHSLFMDVMIPNEKFTEAEVQLWNANSSNQLFVTSINTSTFD
ncbi:MAG: hypothetical protein RL708_881 [Bacteroidota bacterium]